MTSNVGYHSIPDVDDIQTSSNIYNRDDNIHSGSILTSYLGGDPIATTIIEKIQLLDVLVQESDYGLVFVQQNIRAVKYQNKRFGIWIF